MSILSHIANNFRAQEWRQTSFGKTKSLALKKKKKKRECPERPNTGAIAHLQFGTFVL
jgi:hypothetical protein